MRAVVWGWGVLWAVSAGAVWAQSAPAGAAPGDAMPGMVMPAAAAPDPSMDMPGMAMSAEAMAHHGHGDLGAYSPMRDATGTSWQPDSASHAGLHLAYGPWTVMVHGDATLVYDNQGGPRGGAKTFIESLGFLSAQRALGPGTLTLRVHISLDPQIGQGGYPLLFQTGETADGKTPLIDRQHPHDFVDEVSGTYSLPIGVDKSVFLYVADPGEPALGPVTYLHRFSGMMNPETPISHHWLDSTHVSFGVVTTGAVWGPWKLETSVFTGREPDQHRWDYDTMRLDSESVRLTLNPTRDLSFQVSQGWLTSPEQLTPDENQRRTTASGTYNRAYAAGDWQTTFAWGLNDDRPGRTLDAYLLESTASFGPHTVFGRAEQVDKDDLFEAPDLLAGQAFRVEKLSLGYAYTIPLQRSLALDIGGMGSVYSFPGALVPAYGSNPISFMLFTRIKLR